MARSITRLKAGFVTRSLKSPVGHWTFLAHNQADKTTTVHTYKQIVKGRADLSIGAHAMEMRQFSQVDFTAPVYEMGASVFTRRPRPVDSLFSIFRHDRPDHPTNICIVRGTVSVATIVVVNAGVEIWLL